MLGCVLCGASYHRLHDVHMLSLVMLPLIPWPGWFLLCTLTLMANYYLLFLTNNKVTDHGMWSWKGNLEAIFCKPLLLQLNSRSRKRVTTRLNVTQSLNVRAGTWVSGLQSEFSGLPRCNSLSLSFTVLERLDWLYECSANLWSQLTASLREKWQSGLHPRFMPPAHRADRAWKSDKLLYQHFWNENNSPGILHITHREQQQKTYLRFLTEKGDLFINNSWVPIEHARQKQCYSIENTVICHCFIWHLHFFFPDTAKLSWTACKNYINEKNPSVGTLCLLWWVRSQLHTCVLTQPLRTFSHIH